MQKHHHHQCKPIRTIREKNSDTELHISHISINGQGQKANLESDSAESFEKPKTVITTTFSTVVQP